MRLVLIESPYAGNVKLNQQYARACMRDCLVRGEAPYASHLLYTQPGVLDDQIPTERSLGIEAGLAWGRAAEATVVYEDLGVSKGMETGIARAYKEGRAVEHRRLGEGWRAGAIEEGLGDMTTSALAASRREGADPIVHALALSSELGALSSALITEEVHKGQLQLRAAGLWLRATALLGTLQVTPAQAVSVLVRWHDDLVRRGK